MYKYNISILLFVLFSSCEYDRILEETDCANSPILLTIQSFENTECGSSNGVIILNAPENEDLLEYSINGSTFSSENIFRNLEAGTYSLLARSIATGCQSQSITQEIINEGGLQITVSQIENNTCGNSNGSISVSQENGVAPIKYQLNNNTFQTNNTFEGLASGTYSVTARDASGCESSISDLVVSSSTSLVEDVQPIIMLNCAVNGCHNGSVSPNLESKEAIINNSNRIKSRTGSGTMPPAGRTDLTPQEINSIACWVDEGALNN